MWAVDNIVLINHQIRYMKKEQTNLSLMLEEKSQEANVLMRWLKNFRSCCMVMSATTCQGIYLQGITVTERYIAYFFIFQHMYGYASSCTVRHMTKCQPGKRGDGLIPTTWYINDILWVVLGPVRTGWHLARCCFFSRHTVKYLTTLMKIIRANYMLLIPSFY